VAALIAAAAALVEYVLGSRMQAAKAATSAPCGACGSANTAMALVYRCLDCDTLSLEEDLPA